MNPIPLPPNLTALSYVGIFLLLAGFFLIIAGFNILRVERVTVTPGPKTWGVGVALVLFGIACLLIGIFPDGSLPLRGAEASPTPHSTPSFLVEKLHNQSFSKPGDQPDTEKAHNISVPWDVHTCGSTEFIQGYDRHMWVIACKRGAETERLCIAKQLRLYESGRWDEFVKIGNQGEYGAVFEVSFAVVDKDTNYDWLTDLQLSEYKEPGIIPRYQYRIISYTRVQSDKILDLGSSLVLEREYDGISVSM